MDTNTSQKNETEDKAKKTDIPIQKNPKVPGYDEKNPTTKKDIQEHPENQNSG